MGLPERIRETLDIHGWHRTTLDAAHKCIDVGVFTDDWLRNEGIKRAQDLVRKAMSEHDAEGKPIAGQTTETDPTTGARVWAKRRDWDTPAYQLNFDLHAEQGVGQLTIARKLRVEHEDRFGHDLDVRSDWRRYFHETAR